MRCRVSTNGSTGLATPVEVEYAVPQTRMSFGTSADQYAALDRFGRPVDVHWRRGPGATTVVRAQYGYDRSSNRQWRRDARARTATPPVKNWPGGVWAPKPWAPDAEAPMPPWPGTRAPDGGPVTPGSPTGPVPPAIGNSDSAP